MPSQHYPSYYPQQHHFIPDVNHDYFDNTACIPQLPMSDTHSPLPVLNDAQPHIYNDWHPQPHLGSDILFDLSPCSTPSLSVSEHTFPQDHQRQQQQQQQQQQHVAYTSSVLNPNSQLSSAYRRIQPDDRRSRSRIRDEARGRTSPLTASISPSPTPMPRKISGACARCRRLKMKCEFKQGAYSCSRCTTGRHECILEEKKPRNPGERERILSKIRDRESQLESLVSQIQYSTPNCTPLTFIPSKLQLPPPTREGLKNVLFNASVGVGKKPSPGQLGGVRALLEIEDGGVEESSGSGFGGSSSSGSSEASSVSDDGDELGVNGNGRRYSPFEMGLPHSMAPIGFIAQASLQTEDKESFFGPNPLNNQSLRSILMERGEDAPAILVHGLFNLEDVDVLFDIFFKRIHPIVSLLDPDIHTPSAVLVRSPFLFTVICAIASRYLRFSPPPYPLAMHYAKTSAASALIDGRKSVEMVQAYLLMCLYAPGGRRWEESRTWFYSGVAMRLATDLDLHRVGGGGVGRGGGDERACREWNNLVRTWLVCFNLDRSFGTQYGKPFSLLEDEHVRNTDWYKVPFATAYDIHLHGHTCLLRIMARFHEMISMQSSAQNGTLLPVIESFEREVAAFEDDIMERYPAESDLSDEGCVFRILLAPFVTNYSRLVILSHGMQQSFEHGVEPDTFLLAKALHAATAVVTTFVEKVASSGFLLYGPDCYFVYSGFAATFLLKLVDPKFPRVLDAQQKSRIVDLVSRLAAILGSPEVTIDENHTPRLYSRFLSGLLKRIAGPSSHSKRVTLPTTTTAPPPLAPEQHTSSFTPTYGAHPAATNNNNNGTASGSPHSTPSYPTPGYNCYPITSSYGTTTQAMYMPHTQSQSLSQTTPPLSTFPSMDPMQWDVYSNSTTTTTSSEQGHSHPPSSCSPSSFDPAQEIGASWTFGPDGNWSLQEICPNVNYLEMASSYPTTSEDSFQF